MLIMNISKTQPEQLSSLPMERSCKTDFYPSFNPDQPGFDEFAEYGIALIVLNYSDQSQRIKDVL